VITLAKDLFAERRKIMIEMGYLYRHLRDTYGEQVTLEVIDPRNIISLFIILFKQGRKQELGWKVFWRSFTKGLNTMAVIVNGELLAFGGVPQVEIVCDRVEEILKRQR
jgi:hypothetical protein